MADYAKVLEKVVEHAWLAFLIVGAILLIGGATGGSQRLGAEISTEIWRIVVGAVGIVLLGLAFYLKSLEERRLLAGGPRALGVDARTIGVDIVTPANQSSVEVPVTVAGTLKVSPPKGVELWIFILAERGGEWLFWPQGRVTIKDKTSWTFKYKPGTWKSGDPRTIAAFLVGESGQALISYFKKANQSFAPKGELPWVGISKLTADIVQCGEAREVRLTDRLA